MSQTGESGKGPRAEMIQLKIFLPRSQDLVQEAIGAALREILPNEGTVR